MDRSDGQESERERPFSFESGRLLGYDWGLRMGKWEVRGRAGAGSGCGRAIAERAVLEAEGAIGCACGASIAVRAATKEHRAGDTRLRHFVGERPFSGGVVIGDAPHTFFALVGGKR